MLPIDVAHLDESRQTAIAEICRRHHVARLSLFGSALRGALTSDSDIDLLVEFLPGHTPGLAFFAIQDELSDVFQWPVELNTPGFLSKYFRAHVAAEAVPIYAA